MTTYPYTTDDGIIQLVRKDDHAAVVQELNERLTKQQADRLDTIVQLRAELTRWQSLAEMLVAALKDIDKRANNSDIGSADFRKVCRYDIPKALAAYESAKCGNLPDPLAEAVKRMEAVPCEELNKAYWNSGQVANSEWGCDRVRARLISAAKGEQP